MTKFRRLVDAALAEPLGRVEGRYSALTASLADLRSATDEIRQELARVSGEVRATRSVADRSVSLAGAQFDRIGELRRLLEQARASGDYRIAFSKPEPLVSIRIATYNGARLLTERAIPSALAQTYENIEVVVVGDHCTDDTERLVGAIADPRVRFVNLPFRSPYPSDRRHRWMVAGSPAMNVGARMAGGEWIAPLDHDDEFEQDHVEILLDTARNLEVELAYGKLLSFNGDPTGGLELGTYPPVHGQFGFQAAIYPRAFRFFEYEPKSWLLEEPSDWNLCRRMIEAGVRIGWTDRVVTRIYPSGAQAPPGP